MLVRPDEDDKEPREEEDATCKCAGTPAETGAIQDETDHPRLHDVGKPIHEVIQRSCANVPRAEL